MKKLLSILIILAIAFSTPSCSEPDELTDPPKKEEPKPEPEPEPEPEPVDLWNKMKYVSSISYEADGVTESRRVDCTYDEQGRETSFKYYSKGKLSGENTNYAYNGNALTYIYKNYNPDNGSLINTGKQKIVFYGDLFDKGKLLTSIRYEADGVRENYRMDCTYDEQGRETSSKDYSKGKLSSENTNYAYNGNELTYIFKAYDADNGSLIYARKQKMVFYGDLFNKGKLLTWISYEPDGVTEHYRYDFTYDEQGRETSSKYYSNGKLYIEYTNYSYNGNELTYIYKGYDADNGSLTYSAKQKLVFYQKGK